MLFTILSTVLIIPATYAILDMAFYESGLANRVLPDQSFQDYELNRRGDKPVRRIIWIMGGVGLFIFFLQIYLVVTYGT